MRRRYFYWPVSLLSVLIIFLLWGILGILDERQVSDFYNICFWVLFIGYLVYFNYPIIRKITLRDWFSDKKSDDEKLADRHLGVKNSAAETYEVLKPIRFISDHAVYRRLTLVYAAALTLLVILLYYYAPPGDEKPAGDSLQNLLHVSILVTGLIAYTSIPRFSMTKWRDYPYYLAKAYFALGEKEKDLPIRLRFFIDGLEAYNLFLQRNLKIKIRDLQTFYSKLSCDEASAQQEIIQKLCLTFHHSKEAPDELEPFRSIRQTMEKDFKIDLVTGASRRKNLQEWLPLVGLVISSVIAIVQIFAK